MIKVSFDFDGTLSKTKTQKYALNLINSGKVEVWVCTSRLSPENSNPGWNDDLFKVTGKLQIPRDRIIFTNYDIKEPYLVKEKFLWHLDDDSIELKDLEGSNVVGIMCFGNPNWVDSCNNLLNL